MVEIGAEIMVDMEEETMVVRITKEEEGEGEEEMNMETVMGSLEI